MLIFEIGVGQPASDLCTDEKKLCPQVLERR